MELTGDLMERVEQAETREETKKIIEGAGAEAGIILNDAELDQISGGIVAPVNR